MRTSRLKLFRNGLTKLVAGVALALSLNGNIIAQDYYVSLEGDDSRTEQEAQNPSTPWKTIQHAIDSIEGTAENPHTINVAPGTYFENIVMNEYESLKGADRETTILDGNQNGSVVIGASNTTIEDFTIRNGKSEWGGGGIDCKDSLVNIASNIIHTNQSKYGGGAITFSGPSTADAESLFSLVKNNIIYSNVGIAGFESGGIYCNNASLNITGNTLYGNGGGGYWSSQICCTSDFAATNASITNNIIRDSPSTGINILFSRTSAEIKNNLIVDNEGGGIFCSSLVSGHSDCTGPRVVIANNLNVSNKYGVYAEDAVVRAYNNTITNNIRGVRLHWRGQVYLKNNIIWANNDDLYENLYSDDLSRCESFMNVTYCDIGDDDYQGRDGNISADPEFVDPENYDYHLKPSSPCLAPNCALSYDQMGAYAEYFGNIEGLRKINGEIEFAIDGVQGYHVGLYASDSPDNIIERGVKIGEGDIGLDGKLKFSNPTTTLREFYQAVIIK